MPDLSPSEQKAMEAAILCRGFSELSNREAMEIWHAAAKFARKNPESLVTALEEREREATRAFIAEKRVEELEREREEQSNLISQTAEGRYQDMRRVSFKAQDEAEERCKKLEEALRELVHLKDIKDRGMLVSYSTAEKRKAWEVARSALTEQPEKP